MKIDAHQHYWKYNPSDYDWMTHQYRQLAKDFLPEDLAPLLKQIDFDGTILVQARQMEKETHWLLDLSDEYNTILGVVGWLDICSDTLDAQLEKYSSHPKLVGLRHLIHDEPDVNFAVTDAHIRGISKLNAHNLTYDLLLMPPHIKPAIQLVAKFPDQSFVLDHIAKPNIKEQIIQPWLKDLKQLASYENVYCKLSGMVTQCDWHNWDPVQIHPYIDHVMELFGTERVMIGSDWPVCTCAGDYRTTMSVVLDYINEFSDDEKRAILGGNCQRVYLSM